MHSEVRFIPTVSIVINTNGRVVALRHLIESLSHLDYPNFEVCVVCGPTLDGTHELVASYGSTLKSANCPELNISRSRNIGIAYAAGDIIAFIDDDAIPEPEWLTQIVVPFADESVVASGGFVYDHTGYDFQCRFVACDHLGNPRFDLTGPASEYNFPFSNWFPHTLGTNAAFRRTKLVTIGGFDEEYEYFLDETDVCCRLNGLGGKIVQLENAFVHHKFLPSHIRNTKRIITSYYPIIKNKIYFSLINNIGHFSFQEIFEQLTRYISDHRSALQQGVNSGEISRWALENFDAEVQRAWEIGIERGLSGKRRVRPASYFANPPPFQPFPILQAPGGRKTFVFLSENYPPAKMAGVARYTYDVARKLGALGHTVHVLTTGENFNRVDFEEGVWVHRIVPRPFPERTLPDGTPIPQHILNYSASQLDEIDRIAEHRKITVVEGSGWNCECLSMVMDGRYPCIVNLVTPFSFWLDTHNEYRDDPDWMRCFGDAILATERYLFTHSSGIIAASHAIASSVAERYEVNLSGERTRYIPHGTADMASLSRSRPDGLAKCSPDHRLAILFVGRLELRKGIDILLEAAVVLLKARSDIEFWIAGDDTLLLDDGRTMKERFLATHEGPEIRKRIVFLGHVSEEELRWLYAECALVVVPSRFESFGLTVVEAMMFAKPVICCRSGGSEDIVSDGEDGILIEPGDTSGLVTAMTRLIDDSVLRSTMGKAGREKFESRFSVDAIALERIAFLSQFERQEIALSTVVVHGDSTLIPLPRGRQGLLLQPRAVLVLDVNFPKLYVTFYQHPWSGIAEIGIDNAPTQIFDLFDKDGAFRTVEVDTSRATYVRISRPGRARESALGNEVIIAMVQSGTR